MLFGNLPIMSIRAAVYISRLLGLRAESPRWGSGDITQDKIVHWMRQVFSPSCRATPDSLTHLIKYLMQTMFHAWLSGRTVHLCVFASKCRWTALHKSIAVTENSSASSLCLSHIHTNEASGVKLTLPIHCQGQWAFMGQCIVGSRMAVKQKAKVQTKGSEWKILKSHNLKKMLIKNLY